jgi:hypothetical protein
MAPSVWMVLKGTFRYQMGLLPLSRVWVKSLIYCIAYRPGLPLELEINHKTMLFCAFHVSKISALTGGECHNVDRITH